MDAHDVRASKRHVSLPIGRAARLAFDIDTMRAGCCKAANLLLAQKKVDEAEVEECARLDEALAKAHLILKAAIREVMLSRITRRSRTRK
jgi:hypothetical protein